PRERGLIEATIGFANLRTIASNREVEDLFRIWDMRGSGTGHAHDVEFNTIEEGSTRYADETQPRLRRWLKQTICSNAGRAQTASEVMEYIPRDIRAVPVFDLGRLWYDFQLTGVEAGCALAVALILDNDRGLTGRLQQCTLSTCGRFNVDFDACLRPRPRKYCSVSHRTLANYEQSPERMRQWRKAA